jgi:hypothetical protein
LLRAAHTLFVIHGGRVSSLIAQSAAVCVLTGGAALSQQLPATADEIGQVPVAIDYETARFDKVVTAVRIHETITLDGHLDEPAWQLAAPATDFTQWGRPGLPATNRSEVRFLYDDDNLYVGFDCWDKNIARRVVNELQEDFNFRATDGISVIIDSLHDRRSGFNFGTNPAGARRDAQISNDGRSNNDWDGVWDVKVSIDERGWIAEFVIPFKTLRFSNAATLEWGLNLSRRVLSLSEENMWAPIPIHFGCCLRMSMAGTLRGIENINQGRNLTVKPFVTAGVTHVGQGGRTQTMRSLGNIRDYDGGVDLKYGVTPSLTLDATYHTDFAQVEADQQQVNLTRFSLFFPEKRDFFLENQGTFEFGPGGNLLPFFSRRIGLSGSGTPIPIVGGARLSGTRDRYDIGFLTMRTEELDTGGARVPSNTFVVGRLKRNVLARSWIGAIVTNRDSTNAGDYNRVYGTDAHFLLHNRLEVDSYILRSDTPGKTGKNQARRFQTGWRELEWAITGQYNQVQTNFNPEVGFVRRKDHSQYTGEFAWKPLLRQSDTIRNLNVTTTVDYYEGGSGAIETRTQDLTLGMQLHNNGSANFTMTETFDRLEQGVLIQGLPLAAGDYRYRDYLMQVITDASEKISGTGSVTWGDFWDGRRRSLTGGLALKPSYRLNATFDYTRNVVALARGSSATNLVGARVLYGFSPRSFVNAFVQYNSETDEVSTNIRFNLTYRPLSDIYLVYNDRRSSLGTARMERAFSIKVTNLFNF